MLDVFRSPGIELPHGLPESPARMSGLNLRQSLPGSNLTDPTPPQSARRFATFLDRESCVWMPSPSVALLTALITGKGRPKRLLAQDNAPMFLSNIGLIIGATTVNVPPDNVDEALKGVLRTEGLRAEQVWAVATHRDGKLSPTDWLTRCAANGIPTIELCLGSLFALARWSPFPATFTIIDLDAEEAFAGARLTALLTSDRKTAARVQELCLPSPGAQDYICLLYTSPSPRDS